MSDINIILENYWEKFSVIFPKVLKEQFISWIEEDTYFGWEDLGHRHAGGRRELKMLYATIRASKPTNILEIGTYKGDSSNHILLACEKNAEEGHPAKVNLLDINNYITGNLHNKKIVKKC